MNETSGNRSRSIVQRIGIDLSLTLVAIACLLLVVRLRTNDQPKDIEDVAKIVCWVEQGLPAHLTPVFSLEVENGSASVSLEPELGKPRELPSLFLIDQVGTSVIKVRLELMVNTPNHTQLYDAASSFLNPMADSKKKPLDCFGPDLPRLHQMFNDIQNQQGKLSNGTEDELASIVLSIRGTNSSDDRYGFMNSRSFTFAGDYANGYLAYRIDRIRQRYAVATGLFTKWLEGAVGRDQAFADMRGTLIQAAISAGLNPPVNRLPSDLYRASDYAKKISQIRCELLQLMDQKYDELNSSKANTAIDQEILIKFNQLAAHFEDNSKDGFVVVVAWELVHLFQQSREIQVKISCAGLGDGEVPLESSRELSVEKIQLVRPSTIASCEFSKQASTEVSWVAKINP